MIKKFNLFEKYEDVDPYGEEDWNDDTDGFQIGDKLKCVKDVQTISGKKIIYVKGKDYYISHRNNECPGGAYVEIISETGSKHTFLLRNINNWFVKSVNESKLNEGRIGASLLDMLNYLIAKSAANLIRIPAKIQVLRKKAPPEELEELDEYVEKTLDQMQSITFLNDFIGEKGKPYLQSISLNKDNIEVINQKLSIMEELYEEIYYRDFKDDMKKLLKFYNNKVVKTKDTNELNFFEVVRDTYNRVITEVDPYGEEDWLDESKLNESINKEDLIRKRVTLNNRKNALHKRIKGKWTIIDTKRPIGWSFIVENIYEMDGYTLLGQGFMDEDYLYDINNFDLPKPPKRIFSQEDPYGEEDWNVESIEHSDVDPYGEEDWEEDWNTLAEVPIDRVYKGMKVMCIKNTNLTNFNKPIKKGEIKIIQGCGRRVYFTDTPDGWGAYPKNCFKLL